MNHILITGATGALGSELIPRFLRDPATRVSVLLRADSLEMLAGRREKLLGYLRLDSLEAGERIDAVQGDTSQPNLGLEPEQARRLSGCLTHIVHAAGNVKLNQPLIEARRTAVESARHIVDFTHRCCASGAFRKLEFISTVGVAGRRSGVISEARFAEPRQPTDFHNTYEAAKWEAEQFLWGEIDDGLPATVHRPSMIVGDSRDGRIIHFQVFYFLTEFLIGRKTWGIVPKTAGAVLDIIPVDYVADAICLASNQQLGLGEVWHLCTGKDGSWSLDRLVARIRDLLQVRGERLPSLKRLSRGNFRMVLRGLTACSSERSKRFLRGLPFLLDYLDSQQQFDNSRTNQSLAAHGLTVPTVDSYLPTIMEAFWQRPKNKKGS